MKKSKGKPFFTKPHSKMFVSQFFVCAISVLYLHLLFRKVSNIAKASIANYYRVYLEVISKRNNLPEWWPGCPHEN
jgi:hypothetical protein